MIVAALIVALMQEGPVQTAPPALSVDVSAYAAVVRAREAQATAQPSPGVATRIEDCDDPARRRPGEEAFTCASRVRTEAWVRSVRADGNEIEWEPSAAVQRTSEHCAVAANREPNEAEFDCALRLTYALQGDDRVRRPGFRTGPTDGAVPASGGASGDGQNCRMVMRRSESGFGGSLSRVCGDEATAQDLPGRLEVPAQPRPEPCDRPGSLETQAAWIARCRALPVR